MISIFAKPPFENRHLQRVSSIICGEQIAAYMPNVRLNPESGYEDDVCIFVKPHIKPDVYFEFPKNSWVNVNDGDALIETLKKYPQVGLIAYSELAYKELSNSLPNEIVLIPQHHLNFEREKRKRNKIKKVGTTGSYEALKYIPNAILDGLKKRGIEFELFSTFYPRTLLSKFHQNIDVHIHWREFLGRRLSCPSKIIGAASFGVPTIALDEPSFSEVGGSYLPVKTPEEWLEKFDALVENPSLYNTLAEEGLRISEKYHISKIAELYRRLDEK